MKESTKFVWLPLTLFWLIVILLLTGCAAKPYAEFGLQFPVEKSTDYWVHPDRDWQCEAPWFDFQAGYEWPNQTSVGIYHYSTVRCGSYNKKPEVYYNAIRISKRFGGAR